MLGRPALQVEPMPLEDSFLTVYDLDLSPEEEQIWGGLPRTADEYPQIDGLSARDSALLHIVILCVHRGDRANARRYAEMISDPHTKRARLGVIESDEGNRAMTKNRAVGAEELTVANSFEIDALVNVLVRKGIVTEDEILNEIRQLRSRLTGLNGRGSA